MEISNVRILFGTRKITLDLISTLDYCTNVGYHTNSGWEFHLLTAGTADVYIDNTTYRLSENNMYLVAPGVVHGFCSVSDTVCREICVSLTIGKKKEGTSAEETDLLLDAVLGNTAAVLPYPPELVRLSEEIQQEYLEKKPAYNEYISQCLSQMLILIGRAFVSPIVRSSTLPINRRRVIDGYLNTHLADFNIQELISLSCTSPRQLRRVIRQEYGCTLSQILMKKRLNRACQLLSQSGESIASIAGIVGFSSQKYFSVSFRTEFGVTPSAYRKNNA